MRTEHRSRLRWVPWSITSAVLAAWVLLATAAVPSADMHRELTGREWQHIVTDPDAHIGVRIVLHGLVTQAGSGTRRDLVRATVDGLDRLDARYATPAVLHGADPRLGAGDTFRAAVTLFGWAGDALLLRVDRIIVLTQGG